jgi:phosphatidylglycerophosphate synthase
MVNEEKVIDRLVFRDRLGTILIWSGVFVWLPFLFLKAVGAKPVFLLFLPVHLVGVIGGSRLRMAARQQLGMAPPKRNVLRLVGHSMILLGILVWVPYLYLKLAMGQPVTVMSYLPYHLAGVLGGVFLHILSHLRERLPRR